MLLLTTTTTTRATMAGRPLTRAGAMLVLEARPGLTRLLMDLDTLAKTLLKPVMLMQVPRDRITTPMAPMTTLVVAANGLLVPRDGTMLLVMATVVPPHVVAVIKPPMPVPIVTEARPLTLTVMVIWLLPHSDVMDPALTLLLRVDMAGVLLQLDTLMLEPTLKAVPKLALMVVAGQMPAVTPTLPLIPLDAVTADGAKLLRVQLMPSLAKTVSRSATHTVVMPRTSMAMLTVPPMLVLAATVATKLMAVALVLLATLPTLADKVLPCVSEQPVEIVLLELVEVAMPTDTLELDSMQMKVTVPVASEVLLVVVLATLVNALLAFTETIQMLVLAAEELLQLVFVEVLMVVPEATASMVRALVAMVLSMAAMAVFAVMVAQLDMAVINTATAMAAEVAMASAATAAMVVAWAAMAVTVATEDTIESCEIKKTTAKRRF